jgi:uncharacterized protein (TIGR02246 family)
MKTVRPFRIALLAAALALAGAAAAKEGPLDGMSTAWAEAFAKGDVDAVAAFYTEDGAVLPPNMARVQGRANIAAFIKTMTDAGYRVQPTATDTWIEGRLGARSGTYVVLDKDGKQMDHGKWVEVWHRGDDGKWLIVRDIWNSDDPPPPPPTTGVSSDNK